MMKKALIATVLFLTFALRAYANPIACADSTSPCQSGWTYGVAITASSATQILAADGNRRCLLIQNQPQSASSICIAQGRAATYSNSLCNGWVIPAGTPYIYSNLGTGNNQGNVPTSLISMIGTSGGAEVTYSFCD